MTSSHQPVAPYPCLPHEACVPVDPPSEYARFRDEQPLTRIRLWDGSEAWLATRYQDVRQILFDPRFSIMPSRPGFPFVSASRASMLKGEKHNFAFMDTRHIATFAGCSPHVHREEDRRDGAGDRAHRGESSTRWRRPGRRRTWSRRSPSRCRRW